MTEEQYSLNYIVGHVCAGFLKVWSHGRVGMSSRVADEAYITQLIVPAEREGENAGY